MGDVTAVLQRLEAGERGAISELLPLVYGELRGLAAARMRRLPPGQTLQPTALVHEAFLKLAGGDREWSGRDHFLAVAAKAMRQVLVDHARRRSADKRGGGMPRADISVEAIESDVSLPTREMRVLELDALLHELATASPRAARVAEFRLFGGMEQEQIARALGVARMTVHRDWQIARAWLAAKMQEGGHG